MADNFEKFIADAKRVKLTPEEKSSLRRMLSASLHINPLPRVASGWNSFRFPALVALGIILVLIGVPYAADKSLPGSPLYTIKIHVNEPALRTLEVTEEGEIEFDIESAERRQAEIEALAASSGF
ncbi:MAG: hypothetical protein Q8P35_01775 [Candidatus Yanofskybacteria bacterium]|nr:hypothetical protein [Candidatus Yanofskybacteria bacterium]